MFHSYPTAVKLIPTFADCGKNAPVLLFGIKKLIMLNFCVTALSCVTVLLHCSVVMQCIVT